jgi:hypothetical protein
VTAEQAVAYLRSLASAIEIAAANFREDDEANRWLARELDIAERRAARVLRQFRGPQPCMCGRHIYRLGVGWCHCVWGNSRPLDPLAPLPHCCTEREEYEARVRSALLPEAPK